MALRAVRRAVENFAALPFATIFLVKLASSASGSSTNPLALVGLADLLLADLTFNSFNYEL